MARERELFLPVEIHINSDRFAPDESEWQESCHEFYKQIRKASDISKVEPLKKEIEEEGHRGGFIDMFNTITTGISSIGGLTAIISIAQLWLQYRKGSQVTIKLPENIEITLPTASESEIKKVLDLYKEKLAPR